MGRLRRQALKTFDNRLNAELTRVIDAELDKYYSDRSGIGRANSR